MEKITSKGNELIKSVKKLLTSSNERKAQGLFVLEGARLVFDALNSFFSIKYFFITSQAYDKYKNEADFMLAKAQYSFFITNEIADKLSETKNTQGVFAVCEIKDSGGSLDDCSKLILLDNVSDPGNVGTIIRTAEALGIDGVVVSGGCDMYNPKVLRASMGSILRLKVFAADDSCDMISRLKSKDFKVYATVPDSNAESISSINFDGKAVCVIGNEANGISDDVKAVCDESVTIRMLGNAESLNASVAAAITMWEMLR